MIMSWSINAVRFGSLVLVIHDQVDWMLAVCIHTFDVLSNMDSTLWRSTRGNITVDSKCSAHNAFLE